MELTSIQKQAIAKVLAKRREEARQAEIVSKDIKETVDKVMKSNRQYITLVRESTRIRKKHGYSAEMALLNAYEDAMETFIVSMSRDWL